MEEMRQKNICKTLRQKYILISTKSNGQMKITFYNVNNTFNLIILINSNIKFTFHLIEQHDYLCYEHCSFRVFSFF